MSEQAAYRRIASELRERIIGGEFRPGEELPGAKTLQDHYGVGRQTIIAAMGRLAAEGFITTRQGAHAQVADWKAAPMPLRMSWFGPNPQPPAPERNVFQSELAYLGRIGSTELEVARAVPPPEIALRLGTEEATVRRKRQVVDGQPRSYVESWFPLPIADGTELESPTSVQRGTNRVLADLGYPVARIVTEIAGRMPRPEERELLSIPDGVPVLTIVQTRYCADGLPVEVDVHLRPCDRNTVVYETELG